MFMVLTYENHCLIYLHIKTALIHFNMELCASSQLCRISKSGSPGNLNFSSPVGYMKPCNVDTIKNLYTKSVQNSPIILKKNYFPLNCMISSCCMTTATFVLFFYFSLHDLLLQ